MDINEVFLYDNYPKLDLHGITKDIARVMVNDFIDDNIKMKQEFIVIVHGIGMGILKDQVLNTLKNSKKVIDYKLAYNNTGCTIVKLNLTNK